MKKVDVDLLIYSFCLNAFLYLIIWNYIINAFTLNLINLTKTYKRSVKINK